MSDTIRLQCPDCGHIYDQQACDVLGAKEGNVFCPNCGKEVPAEYAE